MKKKSTVMKYTYYKMKKYRASDVSLFIRTKNGKNFEARWAVDDPDWTPDKNAVKVDKIHISESDVMLEML